MKDSTYECKGCAACCRLFLINLNEHEFRSGNFQTEYYTDETFDSFETIEEYGLNILKKNEDGSCIYLIENKCSVYGNRPEVCGGFFCGSDRPEFKEMIEDIQKIRSYT